jgi:hypothetical protein
MDGAGSAASGNWRRRERANILRVMVGFVIALKE